MAKRSATVAVPIVGHVDAAGAGGTGFSAPLALAAFAALGQPTRLEIFRLLVRKEPDGLPAGEIAEAVGAPHNTVSTHLAILTRAGLLRARRDGRSIVYRADLDGMRALVAFLLTDCCDGRPEICGPIATILDGGCGCGPAVCLPGDANGGGDDRDD